jgi:hypothetical protein
LLKVTIVAYTDASCAVTRNIISVVSLKEAIGLRTKNNVFSRADCFFEGENVDNVLFEDRIFFCSLILQHKFGASKSKFRIRVAYCIILILSLELEWLKFTD